MVIVTLRIANAAMVMAAVLLGNSKSIHEDASARVCVVKSAPTRSWLLICWTLKSG